VNFSSAYAKAEANKKDIKINIAFLTMIHLPFLKKLKLVDFLDQKRRYVHLPTEQSMLCQEQGWQILRFFSMRQPLNTALIH
jgi:hypothetical protein